MANRWVPAVLGAPFSADPRILLRNYLNTSSNWTTSGLTFEKITIDTKATENAKENLIVVERMPSTLDTELYMGSLKYVEEHYRIYISAKGWSQINNAYLMVQRVHDLIDANRTTLIAQGIEEMWVNSVEDITTPTEEEIKQAQAAGLGPATTYIIRVCLRYGLIQIAL